MKIKRTGMTSDLARLMIDLRSHLNLTQTDFAKRLKVSQSHLSKIESGTLPPPLNVFLVTARMTRNPGVPTDLFDRFSRAIWQG